MTSDEQYLRFGNHVVTVRIRRSSTGDATTYVLVDGVLVFRAPTRWRRSLQLSDCSLGASWRDTQLGRGRVLIKAWPKDSLCKVRLIVPGHKPIAGDNTMPLPQRPDTSTRQPARIWSRVA